MRRTVIVALVALMVGIILGFGIGVRCLSSIEASILQDQNALIKRQDALIRDQDRMIRDLEETLRLSVPDNTLPHTGPSAPTTITM